MNRLERVVTEPIQVPAATIAAVAGLCWLSMHAPLTSTAYSTWVGSKQNGWTIVLALLYLQNKCTSLISKGRSTERELARDSGLSELARCRYVHNPHACTHRVAAVLTPLKLVSVWLQDNCLRSWTSPSA